MLSGADGCFLHFEASDRPRGITAFRNNQFKKVLTPAIAPDYHTKQFEIDGTNQTSRGENTWNGIKVTKW
jgi:hypothetical protein